MKHEASYEIGKRLDNLMDAVQRAEQGDKDGLPIAQAIVALGNAVKELAPEFDMDSFLAGGMESAFEAMSNELAAGFHLR